MIKSKETEVIDPSVHFFYQLALDFNPPRLPTRILFRFLKKERFFLRPLGIKE